MRMALIFGLVLGSASAAHGYELVSGESDLDTVTGKQLTVGCPKGTVALGAGWAALDETDAIAVGKATYFAPSWDGASWLTNVTSGDGGEAWKLRVTVVCADPLDGYEVVLEETSVDAVPSKQIQPSCGRGRVATGAGFEVLDPTGAILDGESTYFMAAWDASGWLINARNDSDGDWKLRSRLICVSAEAVPGLEVVTEDSDYSDFPSKQVIGDCPRGKRVTSGGWGVLDETDAILEGAPTYSMPGWDGTTWMTNASFDGKWKLRASTTCL